MATDGQLIESVIKGAALLYTKVLTPEDSERLAQVDRDLWSLVDDVEEGRK